MYVGVSCVCRSDPIHCTVYVGVSCVCRSGLVHCTVYVGVSCVCRSGLVHCTVFVGVIRYIGPVEFAEGVWLGVELRTAVGKNDGTVQDKRYFTCKPNHGLIVRPSKVQYTHTQPAHAHAHVQPRSNRRAQQGKARTHAHTHTLPRADSEAQQGTHNTHKDCVSLQLTCPCKILTYLSV